MYCKKCGKELKDDERFCSNCGTANDPEVEREKSSNNTAKKSNIWKIIIPAILVICGLVVAFIMIKKNSAHEINVTDYVSFKSEGYDGYGTLLPEMDIDGLYYEFCQNYKLDEKDASSLGIQATDLLGITDEACFYAFSNQIGNPQLSQTSNLSNGDIVELTWEINENTQDRLQKVLGIKPVVKNISYTVEGLTPVEDYDPFEGVDFSFSGVQGSNNINISTNLPSEFEYSLSSDYSELANGKDVTVALSLVGYPDKDAYTVETGKRITSDSKDIKVDGLDTLVTSFSDIPEQFISSVKENAIKDISNHIIESKKKNRWSCSDESYVTSTYEDPTQCDQYLIYNPNDGVNSLFVLYEVNNTIDYHPEKGDKPDSASRAWRNFEQTFPVYVAYKVDNLLLDSTGKLLNSNPSGEIIYDDDGVIKIETEDPDPSSNRKDRNVFDFHAFMNEDDFINSCIRIPAYEVVEGK